MSDKRFRLFLPERASNRIDSDLCLLTEAISNVDKDVVAHGFLGGEFGYGARYENEVFLMHPYCWCDDDSCDWCGEKRAPNFVHKQSGFSVHWYKWIGRDSEYSKKISLSEWQKIFDECMKSIKTLNPPNNLMERR